jgi:hypothetical protein
MVAPFSGKLAAGIFHHDRHRARPSFFAKAISTKMEEYAGQARV